MRCHRTDTAHKSQINRPDGRERQSEPGLLRSRRTYGGTYPSAGGRVPPTFVIIGNRKEITMEDKRYMDFSDIKLQQPLSNVKRTEKTNDTLIIPANFLTTMERFFDAEKTEYTTIENPSLYSQDKINASLDRFTELDHVFIMEEPVLFISPFDAEALFKWTQQLYGETMDPSYRKYLDDQNAASEEYYYKYEAE